MIGKSKNLRSFTGVKNLPVIYVHIYNAWMTSNIFKEFLLEWDKEFKNEKILLILDNLAEKELRLNNIKMMFLPPTLQSFNPFI